MRTNEQLFELENISKLLQYLYMSEEHTIKYFNGMTTLEISMDKFFNIRGVNHLFPNLPSMDFSSLMNPSYILGLIEKLKETPPEMPVVFENRWEEILSITNSNLGLNHNIMRTLN